MVDAALLEVLEFLTPSEQRCLLAVAEHLISRRAGGTGEGDELLSALQRGDIHFAGEDEGLSPARQAARRFMRENPLLFGLLAD